MARNLPTLAWQTIDESSLSSAQRAFLADVKKAQAAVKAAKDKFERALAHIAPKGQEAVFAYNFGRVSVAFKDKEAAKAASPAKNLFKVNAA